MILKDKKAPCIVVFGGAGFIGRYIINMLAHEGGQIIVPTTNVKQALFLKTMGHIAQIVPIYWRINDDEATKEFIEKADIVINCIGTLTGKGKSSFKNLHTLWPERLAKMCATYGVRRLIHISAIGADTNAKARYNRSKGLGEMAVLKHVPKATILRPSLVIGAEDSFFNRFAKMALISPFIVLIGGGKTKFQPIYVGDVAKSVLKILQQQDTSGKTYELTGDTVYTFRELMILMLDTINRKRKLISLPFFMAKLLAVFISVLPKPPLTIDQVRLLKHHNIKNPKSLGMKDLHIAPRSIESIIPDYLRLYRKG